MDDPELDKIKQKQLEIYSTQKDIKNYKKNYLTRLKMVFIDAESIGILFKQIFEY